MTDVDTLQRANRYPRDQLADLVKTETPRERDLAAVVLANLEIRDEVDALVVEKNGRIVRLEEAVARLGRRIERHGDSAAGPVFKVAPVLDVEVVSFAADPIRAMIKVAIGIGDAPQMVAAFLDESLWLCAVPGVNDVEST